MKNRIKEIRVSDHRLDPAQAEVRITVVPENLTSNTLVRGRLMGPRCPYASTVEVAYPLRETRGTYKSTDDPVLSMRVIIPEASFWDPESPFLYEGPLELWQDGQCCDQAQVSHGLRMVSIGPRGLRVNGRVFTISGALRDTCDAAAARQLRQTGCNTILTSLGVEDASLWETADRLGLFVLCRAARWRDFMGPNQALHHVSCLGLVLDGSLLSNELASDLLEAGPPGKGQLVGVELKEAPSKPLPEGIDFLVIDEELLPALAEVALPKLLWRSADGDAAEKVADSAPGLLGWIAR